MIERWTMLDDTPPLSTPPPPPPLVGVHTIAEVVHEAMAEFHQPTGAEGLLPRHAEWEDSLALTHCVCWRSGWVMLTYLLANPDVFDRLRTTPQIGPEPPTVGGEAE